MTTFDDREKGYERKFIHDQELAYKSHARRNKLLGLWAAEKLGKTGDDADSYIKEVVLSDFDRPGSEDLVEFVLKSLTDGGIAVTVKDIRIELERLTPIARDQIMGS